MLAVIRFATAVKIVKKDIGPPTRSFANRCARTHGRIMLLLMLMIVLEQVME